MGTVAHHRMTGKPVSSPPVTAFQARVYAALCRVPAGRVTTYGQLAAAVGCGSARAVGQALRRNPYAPRVPCHRVIPATLALGGFAGSTGGASVDRKRRLLEAEGVCFEQGRLADRWRLHTFQENAVKKTLDKVTGLA